MKKKIIIGLIVVAIVILSIIVFLNINNSDNDIISKGYKIFGSDYCPRNHNDYFYEDNEHPMMAGQAITTYKCEICNKKYQHRNTATPKICSSCSAITGRCMDCGKLKNENT